jgi:hypothetical protein
MDDICSHLNNGLLLPPHGITAVFTNNIPKLSDIFKEILEINFYSKINILVISNETKNINKKINIKNNILKYDILSKFSKTTNFLNKYDLIISMELYYEKYLLEIDNIPIIGYSNCIKELFIDETKNIIIKKIINDYKIKKNIIFGICDKKYNDFTKYDLVISDKPINKKHGHCNDLEDLKDFDYDDYSRIVVKTKFNVFHFSQIISRLTENMEIIISEPAMELFMNLFTLLYDDRFKCKTDFEKYQFIINKKNNNGLILYSNKYLSKIEKHLDLSQSDIDNIYPENIHYIINIKKTLSKESELLGDCMNYCDLCMEHEINDKILVKSIDKILLNKKNLMKQYEGPTIISFHDNNEIKNNNITFIDKKNNSVHIFPILKTIKYTRKIKRPEWIEKECKTKNVLFLSCNPNIIEYDEFNKINKNNSYKNYHKYTIPI